MKNENEKRSKRNCKNDAKTSTKKNEKRSKHEIAKTMQKRQQKISTKSHSSILSQYFVALVAKAYCTLSSSYFFLVLRAVLLGIASEGAPASSLFLFPSFFSSFSKRQEWKGVNAGINSYFQEVQNRKSEFINKKIINIENMKSKIPNTCNKINSNES